MSDFCWKMERTGHTGLTVLLSHEWLGLSSSCPFCEHMPSCLPQSLPFPVGLLLQAKGAFTFIISYCFGFFFCNRVKKKRKLFFFYSCHDSNQEKDKRFKQAPYVLPPVCSPHIQYILCLYKHLSLPHLVCISCLASPQTKLEKLDVRGKQWALFKLTFLSLSKFSIFHQQLLVELISVFFLNCLQM